MNIQLLPKFSENYRPFRPESGIFIGQIWPVILLRIGHFQFISAIGRWPTPIWNTAAWCSIVGATVTVHRFFCILLCCYWGICFTADFSGIYLNFTSRVLHCPSVFYWPKKVHLYLQLVRIMLGTFSIVPNTNIEWVIFPRLFEVYHANYIEIHKLCIILWLYTA